MMKAFLLGNAPAGRGGGGGSASRARWTRQPGVAPESAAPTALHPGPDPGPGRKAASRRGCRKRGRAGWLRGYGMRMVARRSSSSIFFANSSSGPYSMTLARQWNWQDGTSPRARRSAQKSQYSVITG